MEPLTSSTPRTFSQTNGTKKLDEIIAKDKQDAFLHFVAENPDELHEISFEGENLLLKLSKHYAYKCVEALFEKHAGTFNPHHQDQDGNTALHFACEGTSLDFVTYLLNQGLRIESLNKQGQSALHKAIMYENVPVINLIAAKCTLTVHSLFSDFTLNPLHAACDKSFDCFKAVLNMTSNYDSIDSESQTAMHKVITTVDAERKLCLLIEKKAKCNNVDSFGQTAISIAVRANNSRLVALLLQQNALLTNATIHPLVSAYFLNNEEIFSMLLDNMPSGDIEYMGHKLIDICQSRGSGIYTRKLEEKGEKITCDSYAVSSENRNNDGLGNNVLQRLIRDKNIPSFFYYLTQNPQAANHQNKNGETVLHTACRNANAFIAQSLIQQARLDVNTQDVLGNTALHMLSHAATASRIDLREIIVQLHQAGIKIDQKNNAGNTALFLAYQNMHWELFSLLLSYKADPNIENKEGKSVLSEATKICNFTKIDELFGFNINISARSLHAAIESKQPKILRRYLSHNPKCIHLIHDNKTALMKAVELVYERENNNFVDPINATGQETTDELEIVDILLQKGAKPNKTTSTKCTPLFFAASKNLATVCEKLILAGAKINKRVEKKTPLQVACQNSFLQTIDILLLYGATIKGKKAKKLSPTIQKRLDSYLQSNASLTRSRSSSRMLSRRNSFTSSRTQSGSQTPCDQQRESKLDLGALSSKLRSFSISPRPSSPDQKKSPRTLHEKILAFRQEDTFKESDLRSMGFIAGKNLLQKESYHFPKSMCRIGKSMDIFIEGRKIISRDDSYDGFTQKEKTTYIVQRILAEMDQLYPGCMDKEIIELMSKLEGHSDHETKKLDIYDGADLIVKNKGLVGARLIAKEAALMAILPVQLALQHNLKAVKDYEIRPMMKDQWHEVHLTKTENGILSIGKTSIHILVNQQKACSIEIEAEMQVDFTKEPGDTHIRIVRHDLEFHAHIPNNCKKAILKAVSDKITQEMSPTYQKKAKG